MKDWIEHIAELFINITQAGRLFYGESIRRLMRLGIN